MTKRDKINEVLKEYDVAMFEADKNKVGLGMSYFVDKIFEIFKD